jgi:hypothetical protein
MTCGYCGNTGVMEANVLTDGNGGTGSRTPKAWVICGSCDVGVAIARRVAKDPAKIAAEIQAEAKRAGTDKLTDEEIKTPADRLADAVEECVAHGGGGALREALNEYRSTRAAHPTFNAIVGNPPDPVMLARLTVDSLTGGALSSLICQVHDNVVGGDRSTRPASTWAWKENLSSNLRALGEKLP